MSDIKYSDGTMLFRKKDNASTFYVLKEGNVELFDPDHNKILATLKPGASFGEQAILSGGVRSVSARAVGRVVCIEISADALKKMLEGSPGIIKPVFEALLLQLYMHNELRGQGHNYNQ